jgi:tetratricopeptide (TPR) repeat protein
LLEESLAIQRALGDQTEVTNALKFLVQVDCHEGKLEQAEALAQQCVVIARAAQNLTAVADALLTLACVQAYQGAFSAAHELLVEVIALCDDIGAQDLSCVAQDVRTWMKMNLGDYGAALPVKQANLARFRQIGDAAGIGIELLGTGEIAMAEGRLTDAVALISESADLMGKIGQRIEQGLALAHLAQSTSLRGHPIQARSYLRQALQAASETHNFAAGLSSIVAAAVCLAGEGQAERAVELYSLATRYPYVGNSRFREDVAGKHIVALVGSLSPETIAAAQARGRARELRSTLAELVDEFGQADRVERSTAPCG